MKSMARLLAAVLLCLSMASAQAPPQKAAPPAANPADVKSIESTITALYDVISGPAGQKRDWNRFRSLFWPGARLMPVSPPQNKNEYAARVLTVDEYISRAEPFFEKEGFFETGLANRIDQWAHIVQVFSTYESRHAKGDKPFARGINSIQLFNDGRRWWVLSILWESESEQNPIPQRLLKPPGRAR